MKKYGFGVDIGGTTCKIGFFETTGVLLDKWEIKTNTENNGASILMDVAAELMAKLKRENISKEDVQGVGIGVPGPVTADGTVNRCINLGWGVFNVVEEMRRITGFTVKAGNDANLAALGEMWKGGAEGYSDVVMITLGTGVGGGIIVNGSMIAGSVGGGGEIGHIMVDENETAVCSCGKRGCLEQYASATGIVRMAKERLKEEGETVLREVNPLTAKDIFDAAKAGDEIANELVKKLGRMLGSTLAAIACVTNPEIFVIGGGVSRAGQILIDVVKDTFQAQTFHACRNAQFALAKLGNDAGIYGGVRLITENEDASCIEY